MKSKLTSLLKILLALAIPVLLLLGWLKHWYIYDTWRLHNYQPSTEIQQLATDTTMNDGTRRLFYVYHPELEEKEQFNGNCKTSEKTIVLGCYVSGDGIHLFKVTDSRLAGVLQVTAAHETLHAAYERLSAKEKLRVNGMIQAAYKNIADGRIHQTIEDYRKNGADTDNELHSILGTEVRNLPADLEAYYSRYFRDRKAVVAYSEKYEQAFTERKQKVDDYDKQLASLKEQIDAGEADLTSREQRIDSERARLDSLLAAKDYTTYNAGVPGFNALVSAYNARVNAIRGQIDQYNQIVKDRNDIVVEEGQLVKAIDSRPNTLQSQ